MRGQKAGEHLSWWWICPPHLGPQNPSNFPRTDKQKDQIVPRRRARRKRFGRLFMFYHWPLPIPPDSRLPRRGGQRNAQRIHGMLRVPGGRKRIGSGTFQHA